MTDSRRKLTLCFLVLKPSCSWVIMQFINATSLYSPSEKELSFFSFINLSRVDEVSSDSSCCCRFTELNHLVITYTIVSKCVAMVRCVCKTSKALPSSSFRKHNDIFDSSLKAVSCLSHIIRKVSWTTRSYTPWYMCLWNSSLHQPLSSLERTLCQRVISHIAG